MKFEIYDATTDTTRVVDIPSTTCRKLFEVLADNAGNWIVNDSAFKVRIVYELRWTEQKPHELHPSSDSMKFTRRDYATQFLGRMVRNRRQIISHDLVEHRSGWHECYR